MLIKVVDTMKKNQEQVLIQDAYCYAEHMHEGQTRKTDGTPMFTHPVRVSKELESAGFDEKVIMAGLLHDTVEDTAATLEEIEQHFGKRVAELVAGNTENKEHGWEERKQHTIDALSEATLEVRALIVADKLDNLKAMMKAYQKQGDALFEHFKRGKAAQLWYFNGVAENMMKNIEHLEPPTFFLEYKRLVEEFEILLFPELTR